MTINIQVSPQYQGMVELAGAPQNPTNNNEGVSTFTTLSDIPANFDGVAAVGNQLITGNGIGKKLQRVLSRISARTLIIGDSLAERCGEANGRVWNINGAAESSVKSAQGLFTTLNLECNNAFNIVRNAGIAGQNTAEILARMDDELANYGPFDVVVDISGTNDIGVAGFDANVTAANKIAIAEKAIAHGAFHISFGIPPKDSIVSAIGVQHKAIANRLVQRYCQLHENCYYIPTDQLTNNNSGVDGHWAAAYAPADGTHPDKYETTYAIVSPAIADLKSMFPGYPTIQSSCETYDGIGSPATPPFGNGSNILTRQMSLCIAAGGTNTAATGVTYVSTPPAGYTLQGSGSGLTLTSSLVARSDGRGNQYRIQFDATGGVHAAELFYQNGTKYAAGKWYEFVAEIELISGPGIINDIQFGIRAATGSLTYVRDNDVSNMLASSVQPVTFKRVFVTPRIPYQGTDQMRAFITITSDSTTGTAVVGISLLSITEYDRQVDL